MGCAHSDESAYHVLKDSLIGKQIPDQDIQLFFDACKVQSKHAISSSLPVPKNLAFWIVTKGQVVATLSNPRNPASQNSIAVIYNEGDLIHFFDNKSITADGTIAMTTSTSRQDGIKLSFSFDLNQSSSRDAGQVVGMDRMTLQLFLSQRPYLEGLTAFFNMSITSYSSSCHLLTSLEYPELDILGPLMKIKMASLGSVVSKGWTNPTANPGDNRTLVGSGNSDSDSHPNHRSERGSTSRSTCSTANMTPSFFFHRLRESMRKKTNKTLNEKHISTGSLNIAAAEENIPIEEEDTAADEIQQVGMVLMGDFVALDANADIALLKGATRGTCSGRDESLSNHSISGTKHLRKGSSGSDNNNNNNNNGVNIINSRRHSGSSDVGRSISRVFTGWSRKQSNASSYLPSSARGRGAGNDNSKVVPFTSSRSTPQEDELDTLFAEHSGDEANVVELGAKNLRSSLLQYRLPKGTIFGLENFLWEKQQPAMVLSTTAAISTHSFYGQIGIRTLKVLCNLYPRFLRVVERNFNKHVLDSMKSNIPLLRAMDDYALQSLSRKLVFQSFEPHTHVFRQGEQNPSMYIVIRGSVVEMDATAVAKLNNKNKVTEFLTTSSQDGKVEQEEAMTKSQAPSCEVIAVDGKDKDVSSAVTALSFSGSGQHLQQQHQPKKMTVGFLFGEMATMSGLSHMTTVMTLEPTLLICISKAAIEASYNQNKAKLAEVRIQLLGRESGLQHVVYHPRFFRSLMAFMQKEKCNENLDFFVQVERYEDMCDRVVEAVVAFEESIALYFKLKCVVMKRSLPQGGFNDKQNQDLDSNNSKRSPVLHKQSSAIFQRQSSIIIGMPNRSFDETEEYSSSAVFYSRRTSELSPREDRMATSSTLNKTPPQLQKAGSVDAQIKPASSLSSSIDFSTSRSISKGKRNSFGESIVRILEDPLTDQQGGGEAGEAGGVLPTLIKDPPAAAAAVRATFRRDNTEKWDKGDIDVVPIEAQLQTKNTSDANGSVRKEDAASKVHLTLTDMKVFEEEATEKETHEMKIRRLKIAKVEKLIQTKKAKLESSISELREVCRSLIERFLSEGSPQQVNVSGRILTEVHRNFNSWNESGPILRDLEQLQSRVSNENSGERAAAAAVGSPARDNMERLSNNTQTLKDLQRQQQTNKLNSLFIFPHFLTIFAAAKADIFQLIQGGTFLRWKNDKSFENMLASVSPFEKQQSGVDDDFSRSCNANGFWLGTAVGGGGGGEAARKELKAEGIPASQDRFKSQLEDEHTVIPGLID